MKKYFSIIRFFILASVFILTGCVHDDKYDAPDLSGNCQDLKATITLEAAKSLAQNTTITTDAVIEGYVSSTDQSGNIYKTIMTIKEIPDSFMTKIKNFFNNIG